MEWVGIQAETSSPLRRVLEEWLALNRHCVDTWEGDVPWRYNEQATLSYFAGAIWRSGGFALEEYSRHKSNSKHGFGRGDLWFELDDREYDIEAKFCRVFLNEPYEPESHIQSSLGKAVSDINSSRAYDDRRVRCALLASTLAIDLTKPDYEAVLFDQGLLEARLERWIYVVKSAGDMAAWFIREDKQWPVFTDGWNPDALFPGIALVLRSSPQP
jgi:hypothetical protein